MTTPSDTTSQAGALAPLVIYHAKCADGFSAAWCFHHQYSQSGARPYPEFVAGRYGYAPPDCTGRDVYLVDFSYKRDVVEQLLAQANSVTLIDHHQTALQQIDAFLPEQLHVRLNPAKTILQPVDRGVDFVGQVIKPWCRSTRRRTVATAAKRLHALPKSDLFATANSYFGLLRQASASHEDRALIANVLRRRGKAVSGSLTKTYRSN